MFLRSSKVRAQTHDTRTGSATEKAVPSIISSDLVLEGNLTSNGEVQVDGRVKGDINCKALVVVGVKGSVTGEIVARAVRVHGAIEGVVRAKSVFLASTARMSGDVEHESLAIEPGAFLNGYCKRISEIAAVVETPQRVEVNKKPATLRMKVSTPSRVIPSKAPKAGIAAT
jgi:cytoskeletal protein CcmA (bactofilin family)